MGKRSATYDHELFIRGNEEVMTNVKFLKQVHHEEEKGRIDLHAATRNSQNILINYALRNTDHSNPTACDGSSISFPKYDVDEKDSNGMTPLALAARFGRLSATKCLLDHGADMEIECGVRNWRPLHFATYYCHPAGIYTLNGCLIISRRLLPRRVSDSITYSFSCQGSCRKGS